MLQVSPLKRCCLNNLFRRSLSKRKGISISMSQVLVSGSAGFIGGYVVEELLKRGHHVTGIDNLFKIRSSRQVLR